MAITIVFDAFSQLWNVRNEGGLIALCPSKEMANLILAAPDLLAACEAWEELWNTRPMDSGSDIQAILARCWYKTAHAIGKAKS